MRRQMLADVDVAVPAGVTTATHISIYNAADGSLHIKPLTTPRTGLVENDIVRVLAAETFIEPTGLYVAP